MSTAAITIIGSAILFLLLAGYIGQKFLPPPKPKIVGIDLGTTFSCIGAYHAVTGKVDIIPDDKGHFCIPSVVAFTKEGKTLIGYEALFQADHNPLNTFYDSKRFIGKVFSKEELQFEQRRYPFQIKLIETKNNNKGNINFYSPNKKNNLISTQEIGSILLNYLKISAQKYFNSDIFKAVMSVPAEFDSLQREETKEAARLAGIEVVRIINEPTAAALAYGLHNKTGVQDVLVVDLGGGTLDVSLLDIQGGMFLTRAMAGNNHLGGQDFNERLKIELINQVENHFHQQLIDMEDIQLIRKTVEEIKVNLTTATSVSVSLSFQSMDEKNYSKFKTIITRELFNNLNKDLFIKVLEPIKLVLESADLEKEEVEDVVLVGGSTRIPKIREIISNFFNNKKLNFEIDPELAVITGVATQAGIVGGAWPLSVSAVEVKTAVQKIIIKN